MESHSQPAPPSERYSPGPDDSGFYDITQETSDGSGAKQQLLQPLHEAIGGAQHQESTGHVQHQHQHQQQPLPSFPEYYDNDNPSRHDDVPSGSGSKQPLQESTGNAQYSEEKYQHELWRLEKNCARRKLKEAGYLKPMQDNLARLQRLRDDMPGFDDSGSSSNSNVPWEPSPIIQAPPPVLATSYGGSTLGLKLRRQHMQLQRRSRHGLNPIYLSPQFEQYRARQKDKDKQVWTDVLEDAFLDAMLSVPPLGRRKCTMHNNQPYGRNMIIMEYLWIAYLESLPPGAKEDKLMRRERKQVSSHIQVLKGLFKLHLYYHFFFGRGKDTFANGRFQVPRENDESFKSDPVITAITNGRLPDERPNYDYFAKLLASDALITVRPQMCWIYASNTKIRDEAGKTYHESEGLLSEADFPHRYAFTSGNEDWAGRDKEERSIKQTLLHEYTWGIKQCESSSVNEISHEWAQFFPELNAALDVALTDSRCDFIHMHVTLDIHRVLMLPEGSQLNGLVKISIAQPELQSHTWRCVTRLQRPPELCDGEGEKMVHTVHNPIGEMTQHRQGCYDGNPTCECANSRRRGDVAHMPFPADKLAQALPACAKYPAYPMPRSQRSRRQQCAPEQKAKRESKWDASDSEDKYFESKYDAKHHEPEPREIDPDLTQIDLARGIAMLQELSSCPRGMEKDRAAWTRRAVMIWTFDTTYYIDKNKLLEQPAGTSWRFLTALDPYSAAHRNNMLVSSTSSMSRAVMSPSPAYQQLMGAQMNENFNSAFDPVHLSLQGPNSHRHATAAAASMPPSPMPYGPGNLSIMGPFASGLATPPPTAALSSSYASFDTSGVHSQDLGSQPHNLTFMSQHTSASDSDNTLVSVTQSQDSYLPGIANMYEEPGDINGSHSFQSFEPSSLPGMDAHHWSSFNNASHAANNGAAAIDWSHQHHAGLSHVADDGANNSSGFREPAANLQHWNMTMSAPAGGIHADDWIATAASTPSCEGNSQTQWSSQTASEWDDGLNNSQPRAPSLRGSIFDQQQHPQPHHLPEYPGPSTGLLEALPLSRKRTQDEALDVEDDYPVSSMPKLTHQGLSRHYNHGENGPYGAPTPNMESHPSWSFQEK